MGIEPTRPAWKAGILAIELHPQTAINIIAQILNTVKHFLYYFLFLPKNILKNYANEAVTAVIYYPFDGFLHPHTCINRHSGKLCM